MIQSIEICLGSSCFARGNESLLPMIEEFLERRGLSETVELTGLRCQGQCNEGPNITVNGTLYHKMDAGALRDLLERECADAGDDHG